MAQLTAHHDTSHLPQTGNCSDLSPTGTAGESLQITIVHHKDHQPLVSNQRFI